MQNKWTREETILAFDLYCKIPFNKATSSNPEIISYSQLMGRSINSVKMKIGNFGSFDPELKRKGIVGLVNASKMDEEIWNEFNEDLGKLAEISAELKQSFKENTNKLLDEHEYEQSLKTERLQTTKQRIHQTFFRQVVLSSYNNRCCITGIEIPELLIASHIIPWSAETQTRLDARNGVCLNALHDKAFDKGLITITTKFEIEVSPTLTETNENSALYKFLTSYHHQPIQLPERFIPKEEYLTYHRKNIFKR